MWVIGNIIGIGVNFVMQFNGIDSSLSCIVGILITIVIGLFGMISLKIVAFICKGRK